MFLWQKKSVRMMYGTKCDMHYIFRTWRKYLWKSLGKNFFFWFWREKILTTKNCDLIYSGLTSVFLMFPLSLSLPFPLSLFPIFFFTLSSPTVCSARVIFESDLMQDFLCLQGNDASKATAAALPPQDKKVEILVLLPDGNKLPLNVQETAQPSHVLAVRVCVHVFCMSAWFLCWSCQSLLPL